MEKMKFSPLIYKMCSYKWMGWSGSIILTHVKTTNIIFLCGFRLLKTNIFLYNLMVHVLVYKI